MPVAPEDRVEVGVLGLEATHRWEHGLVIPDLLGDALVLNDPVAWPRWRVKKLEGLHAGAERTADSAPLIGRIGNAGRPVRIGPKTVVYEGWVFGRTLQEVRLAKSAMLAAFAVQTPRVMRVVPHEDYAGGTEHVYTATVLACDCDDEQKLRPTAVPSAFGREWMVSLRLDDPRTYNPDEVEAVGDSGNDYVAHVVNGWAPTDCVIEVTGPIDEDWSIVGTYGTLQVDGVPLAGGQSVTVDTRRGAIVDEDGEPVGVIASVSSLWDAPATVPPGESDLELVGAGRGVGTQLRATYRRAYW